jgi:hypothetical protein
MASSVIRLIVTLPTFCRLFYTFRFRTLTNTWERFSTSVDDALLIFYEHLLSHHVPLHGSRRIWAFFSNHNTTGWIPHTARMGKPDCRMALFSLDIPVQVDIYHETPFSQRIIF